MRIAGVFLRDFEPFTDQLLEFPEKPKDGANLAEVHFFVGQNGTGKTRLLSLLAAACGNPEELKYRTDKKSSAVVLDTTIVGSNRYYSFGNNDSSLTKFYERFKRTSVGQNFAWSAIVPPDKCAAMSFRSIPSLEDPNLTAMGSVTWGDRTNYLKFNHHSNESKLICQAIANMKIRMGIVSSDENDRTVRMIHAFDRTIKSITDRDLILTVGYVGQEFRLKAKWDGKEIQLKQLPDGLRSIVGWLASVVVKLDMMYPEVDNPLEQPIILLLDEPDAHLHPAWQRKLIPAVQKLLPNAQIFIATHSPFVVSSVNHGWIHVFEADNTGIVTIKKAQQCSSGDSYIDVVEDILGVREMFDPETEELLKSFRAKKAEYKKQPSDQNQFDNVINMAQSIAERSETLKAMMGREIAQLHYQRHQVAG